jgi:hypothetical protein
MSLVAKSLVNGENVDAEIADLVGQIVWQTSEVESNQIKRCWASRSDKMMQ